MMNLRIALSPFWVRFKPYNRSLFALPGQEVNLSKKCRIQNESSPIFEFHPLREGWCKRPTKPAGVQFPV